eukprot:TRINITY_DN3202_c0_g1_i1.p1 TRINITY_DN3202_c0_g1~~TRINITY_DN3202_c0_g1_i1.p1  ORF type:complete len:425 (+),score=92.60 TRINITY_DN3202_c0_g1_i1:7-1281(+)
MDNPTADGGDGDKRGIIVGDHHHPVKYTDQLILGGRIPLGLYNVWLMSFSFCVLFFAFSSTQNLETTVNKDIGSYSLGVLYVVFALSNFISPFVVSLFGLRGALIIGAVCYTLYIAANMKVVFWIFMGASAINGFGASILWTAQGALITQSAPEGKLGAYNGIFFGVFQWAQILGNLSAGLMLSSGVSTFKLFLIFTCVSGSSLAGFFSLRATPRPEKVDVKERFLATLRLIGDKYMILMYLPMIYSGLSQPFFFGLFPKTIQNTASVGYIMAVFGAADAAGSFLAGYISDKIGRLPIMIFCGLCTTGASVIMLLMTPQILVIQYKETIEYAIAVLLGIADSGFNTQIYAILGTLYPTKPDAAFAVYKFFQAGSSAILFFVGTKFSLTICIYTVNATLWAGMLTYLVLFKITKIQRSGYEAINK